MNICMLAELRRSCIKVSGQSAYMFASSQVLPRFLYMLNIEFQHIQSQIMFVHGSRNLYIRVSVPISHLATFAARRFLSASRAARSCNSFQRHKVCIMINHETLIQGWPEDSAAAAAILLYDRDQAVENLHLQNNRTRWPVMSHPH